MTDASLVMAKAQKEGFSHMTAAGVVMAKAKKEGWSPQFPCLAPLAGRGLR